jgi:hypothetical protein
MPRWSSTTIDFKQQESLIPMIAIFEGIVLADFSMTFFLSPFYEFSRVA